MKIEDRIIYPNLAEPLRAEAIRAHDALHRLWTKAVGTSTYVKKEWGELSTAIEALVSRAKGDDR